MMVINGGRKECRFRFSAFAAKRLELALCVVWPIPDKSTLEATTMEFDGLLSWISCACISIVLFASRIFSYFLVVFIQFVVVVIPFRRTDIIDSSGRYF